MKEIITSGLVGYLLGCFQTSIFIGRIFKRIDIREHGSQNAGASNTTVVLGLSFGLLTAFLDIIKAVVAVVVVRILFPDNTFLPAVAGILAVLGHIFPIFFGFRGGKGVAPLIGTVLALDPFIGLLVALTSVGVALVTDYVVAGSTTIYILFVFMMIVGVYPKPTVWLSLGLLAVAIYKHKENYRRILSKEEMKIKSTLRGEETEHRV